MVNLKFTPGIEFLVAGEVPRRRHWSDGDKLQVVKESHLGGHRQDERYAKKGINFSISTLADQVRACTAALEPVHALIRTHVLAAERLHGEDTTVHSWQRAERKQRGSRPMSEMTRPLLAGRHRSRCSTSRATGKWPIRVGMLQGGRASPGRRPWPLQRPLP